MDRSKVMSDKRCCDMGTYDCCVEVETPKGMYGMSKKVCVDKCILKEIQWLWSQNIHTFGSCCGHGKAVSMVNVGRVSVDKMIQLGYIGGYNKFGSPTFALKTQIGCRFKGDNMDAKTEIEMLGSRIEDDGFKMIDYELKPTDEGMTALLTIKKYHKEPPLGAMPKKVWLVKRRNDIGSAIGRYASEGLEIPLDWIDELTEIAKELGRLKYYN